MSNHEDISALLRIIREQQAIIDEQKAKLETEEHDAKQYRKWWLEERGNIRNLAKAGDRLRNVDPMQDPCPLTEAWDKACSDAGVDVREDDNE